MTVQYGKATFTGGREFFLVNDEDESVEIPLFDTLQAAKDWVSQGFPKLDRIYHDQVETAKFSEEPVHILTNLERSGETEASFYSFASLVIPVITGPASKEESQRLWMEEKGCTKEFFDEWVPKSLQSSKVEAYERLNQKGQNFVDSILRWWLTAQFETHGDRGEYNAFDSDPGFVKMAKAIRSPAAPDRWENARIADAAVDALKWWKSFHNDDGGRPIFSRDPEFIEMAESIVRKRMAADPEP
jgi:hypothetical protein